MSITIETSIVAKIFVTTYGIANRLGYGCGKWFDLADYEDKAEFMAAAEEYATTVLKDTDPELCFSDYQCNIKKGLIDEWSVSPALWELFELDEHELEILQAWLSNSDIINDSITDTMNEAQNAHVGEWDSLEDYATDYLTESCGYDDMPDIVRDNINLKAVGAQLTACMTICGTHYFNK